MVGFFQNELLLLLLLLLLFITEKMSIILTFPANFIVLDNIKYLLYSNDY